ncbi:MAG TPA: rhomboid family intramembrane serine protease [Sedimentisphaerales bacterium]|jgi:GlpG protein|nr:rhomboid family intramembrane serine protease [Sedimentisphaerales bacterium]HNU28105.1 rhomboid family intramembrane serine protease [Sedimentisphaerales bacterium]
MRSIGTLHDETQAKRFGDFLYAKGIESQVDPTSGGEWEIWILDDDHIETSRSLLDQFRAYPDNPVFAPVSRVAARQQRLDETARPSTRSRAVDARTMFYVPPVPLAPVTIALILISIAVAVFTSLGDKVEATQPLAITQYHQEGDSIYWNRPLPEIRQGQIWRLFTPIFLHFGIPHILFNMLWLRDIGSMIEARRSSWLLSVMVLVIAGTSNLAQYLHAGPLFGGMSGVDYGLLGYVWMQGRFNPASRLSLHPQTISLAIVWFFLCLFGLVPHIANMAHAVGLGIGIVWGFIEARARVALHRY